MTATAKYNYSEIMKEAWNLYRTGYGTFSNCLKAAWRGAKFKMKQAMIVAKMEAERIRYVRRMCKKNCFNDQCRKAKIA